MLEIEKCSDKGKWGLDPFPKPRVTIKMEGKAIKFLVDTGAHYSVLTEAHGKLSDKIMGTGCNSHGLPED